eukprot:EG_transcript_2256
MAKVVSSAAIRTSQEDFSTVNVDLTFCDADEAKRAIQCLHGALLDGRRLRAYFRTTKYCPSFLRNTDCTATGCALLHAMADEADHYTREQMLQRRWALAKHLRDVSAQNGCADLPKCATNLQRRELQKSPQFEDRQERSKASHCIPCPARQPRGELSNGLLPRVGTNAGYPADPAVDCMGPGRDWSGLDGEEDSSQPPEVDGGLASRAEETGSATALDSSPIYRLIEDEECDMGASATPALPPSPTLDLESFIAELSAGPAEPLEADPPAAPCEQDTAVAEPLPAGMDPATTTSTDELHSFVVLAAPAAPKVVIPEVANLTSSMDNVDLDVGSVKAQLSSDGSSSSSSPTEDTMLDSSAQSSASSGFGPPQPPSSGRARHVRRQSRFSFAHNNDPAPLVLDAELLDADISGSAFFDTFGDVPSSIPASEAADIVPKPKHSPDGSASLVGKPRLPMTPGAGANPEMQDKARAAIAAAAASAAQSSPGASPNKVLPSVSRGFPISTGFSGVSFAKGPPDAKGLGGAPTAEALQLLPGLIATPSRAMVFPLMPSGLPPEGLLLPAPAGPIPNLSAMKAPNPGLVPGVIPTHVTAFSGAKAAGRGKGTQVGLQTDEGVGPIYMAAWDASSYDMGYDFSSGLPLPSPSLQYLNAFGGPPLSPAPPFSFPQQMPRAAPPAPYLAASPGFLPPPAFPGPLAPTSSQLPTNGALSRQNSPLVSGLAPAGPQPGRRVGQDFAPSYPFSGPTGAGKQSAQYRP